MGIPDLKLSRPLSDQVFAIATKRRGTGHFAAGHLFGE
jgi:hypothetical protein